MRTTLWLAFLFVLVVVANGAKKAVKISSQDYQIDAVDPDIKLFVQEKMREGNLLAARDLEAVQAPLQGWASALTPGGYLL